MTLVGSLKGEEGGYISGGFELGWVGLGGRGGD